MGLAQLLFSGAGVAFYYASDSFVVAPEVEAYYIRSGSVLFVSGQGPRALSNNVQGGCIGNFTFSDVGIGIHILIFTRSMDGLAHATHHDDLRVNIPFGRT